MTAAQQVSDSATYRAVPEAVLLECRYTGPLIRDIDWVGWRIYPNQATAEAAMVRLSREHIHYDFRISTEGEHNEQH